MGAERLQQHFLFWITRIPSSLAYDRATLPSLKAEELEKLARARPATFGEASAIAGITPASLVYLYNHVTRRHAAGGGRGGARESAPA